MPRRKGAVALAIFAVTAWLGVGIYYIATAPESVRASIWGTPSRISLPDVGGPFRLIDQNGEPRSDSIYRGQLMLIYFGYTNCPDVCAIGLFNMGGALDLLGEAGNAVRPIFITIDPARDTVAVMKEYAANFHPRLVALTGDEAAIDAVAKAYHVYSAHAATDEVKIASYLLEHTSGIYLMGVDGRYLARFPYDTLPEEMAEGIGSYF
jgi:cytochrome oxidase Cu insertion factor (SCO1/SenC/PrrC family)